MLFALCGIVFADPQEWNWTGIDAAPNYKPTACTVDGSGLPADSIKVVSMRARNHDDLSYGDLTYYNDIWLNFDVHCPNGVIAHASFHHRDVLDAGSAAGGGSPTDHVWSDPVAGWASVTFLKHNPSAYFTWSNHLGPFLDDPQWVVDHVHSEQESNAGEFLPPPDRGDRRVLARPVLFAHGINSDAAGWGVRYADRRCSQSLQTIEDWSVTSAVAVGPLSTAGIANSSGVTDFAQTSLPSLHLKILMTCVADTHHVVDSVQLPLDPITQAWSVKEPWMGFFYRDNPLVFQFKEDGSNNWVTFGLGVPTGLQGVRVRVLRPKVGDLKPVVEPWLATNPPSGMDRTALDLTDTTQVWWNAMVGRCPSLAQVFQVQNGRIQAKNLLYDTTLLTVNWVPLQAFRVVQPAIPSAFVPWDQFNGNVYSYKLPNTYTDALVREYKFGTGPDIIARIERLDRRYDSTRALDGINHNGIYFYNALNDSATDLSPLQPPMWNPQSYGYTAQRGQALQLFERLGNVLTRHYGSRDAWINDASKQIDIVCHSQGCLDTRDMVRNARDASLSNPVNHIRKVVSLNSPAFGSALATSNSDMPVAFSSMGAIRKVLLDTIGQLIPNKNLSLGFSRLALPLAGGAGGTVEAYNTCSDAVGVPVIAQIAGATCGVVGAGVGVIGGTIAAMTDYNWSINGGLLGPYDLRLRTNTLGFTTTNHFALPSSSGMRKQVTDFADTTRHLGQTSLWIDSLRRVGYPNRPLDNAPIPFSVRYSPTTAHVIDTLGQQVSENIRRYCEDHDDVLSANCAYFELALQSILGTGSVASDPTVNQVLGWSRDFQTQWTDQGDLVVEKGSQLMVDPNFGFNPSLPSLVGKFDTLGYRYQSAYGVGGAKFASHMPVALDAAFDLNGTAMSLHLFRQGATLLGLDIHAALGLDTFAFTHGIQPLPKDGASVLVPPMTAANSPTQGVMQQLPASGDFALQTLSGDSLLQGLAVRTDSAGPLRVVAVWDRNQGVYLTALLANGSRLIKILSNGGRPVRVRLVRHGNTFTMVATGQEGLVDTGSVTLALPAPIWVGALSTPQVAASDSLRPLLMGSVVVTDTSALHPNDPWQLVVLTRQTLASGNLSQPAIVLVNKDTRTLHGFSLFYEFRADPSRVPVLQSYQGPGNATLQGLGQDFWRVRIDVPAATVLPQTLFPSANGFGFQLRYLDGSLWPLRSEWSSYGGSTRLRWSDRIQVRDNNGKVLVGQEMSLSAPPGRAAAVGLGRDEALGSNNLVAPVVVVRNTGGIPLRNFHAVWYVRAPSDKSVTLEPWYTPDAQASLKALGKGLWKVDLTFNRHLLYPGQATEEQKLGIHFVDWSNWNRASNPTAATVTTGFQALAGMVVLDSNGVVLWGNQPNLEDTAIAVVPPSVPGSVLPASVQIRDENPWDNSWIRPRFVLTNLGPHAWSGFAVSLPLKTDPAKVVNVAPWYAPGCQVGLVRTATGADTAHYVCQNLLVAVGAVWPDQGGAVVGFQYADGTPWNRLSDPFVSSWTQNFAPTTQLVVRSVP